MDPGKMARRTTVPVVRYWVAIARRIMDILVKNSKGIAKFWDEASRSSRVIADPYLSIMAFLLSLCH
jgi:hypothetical protein